MSALLKHYETIKAGVKTAEEEEQEAKERIEADKNYARQGAYNIYLDKFPDDPYKYTRAEKAVLGAEFTQFGTVTLGVDAEQAFEDNRKAEGYLYGGLAFLSGLGLGVAAKPIAKGVGHFARMFRGAGKPPLPTSVKSEAFDLLNYNMPEEAFKIDDVIRGADPNVRDLKRQDAQGNFVYPDVILDKSARLGDAKRYKNELKDKARPFTDERALEFGVDATSKINPDPTTLSKFYSGAVEAIDNMTEDSLKKRMVAIKKEDGKILIKESQLENYFKPLVTKGLIRNADYQYVVNEVLKGNPRIYHDPIDTDDFVGSLLTYSKDDPFIVENLESIGEMPHFPAGERQVNFLEQMTKDAFEVFGFSAEANRTSSDVLRDFEYNLRFKSAEDSVSTLYPLQDLKSIIPMQAKHFLIFNKRLSEENFADIYNTTPDNRLINMTTVMKNPEFSVEGRGDKLEELLRELKVIDYRGTGTYPDNGRNLMTVRNDQTMYIDAEYIEYLQDKGYINASELTKDLSKYTDVIIDGERQNVYATAEDVTDALLNSSGYVRPKVAFSDANIGKADLAPMETTGKTTGKYVDLDYIGTDDLTIITKAMMKDSYDRNDNALIRTLLQDEIPPTSLVDTPTGRIYQSYTPTVEHVKRAIRIIDEQDLKAAEDLSVGHSLQRVVMTPVKDGTHYAMPSGDLKLYKQFTPDGRNPETPQQTLDRLKDDLRSKVLARRLAVGQYSSLDKPIDKNKKEKLIDLDKLKQIAKNEIESGEGAYTINFDDRAGRRSFEQEQKIMYPSVDLESLPQIDAGKGLRQYFVTINAKNLNPMISDANNIHDSTEGTIGYIRMSKRQGSEGNRIIDSLIKADNPVVVGYSDVEALEFLDRNYGSNQTDNMEMPNGEPVSRQQVQELIERETNNTQRVFDKTFTKDRIAKELKEKLKILDDEFLLVEEIQSDVHNSHIRKATESGKKSSVEQPILTHDDYTEKLIQSAIVFAKKNMIDKIVIPNPSKIRAARGGVEQLVPNPQKPGEMMKKYVGGMSEDVLQGAYVKGVKKATNKLKKIFGDNIEISSVPLPHTSSGGQKFVEDHYRNLEPAGTTFAFPSPKASIKIDPQEATVIDITKLDFDPDTEYFKYNEGGYVGNVDSQMSELLN